MWSHGLYWYRGELIGQGGFGSVFLATPKNPLGNRIFKYERPPVMAVKSAEASKATSIQREFQVLSEIKGCPFIIEPIDEEITYSHSDKGRHEVYNLLMEFASGGSLGDKLKKYEGYGLPEADVQNYTKAILEGLKYIHNRDYVHCDLKPDNILLVPTAGSTNYLAKIADFGLCKRSTEILRRWRGTRAYLSPEAVNKYEQEPPSDIWALGCILLEMLSGKSIYNFNRGYALEDIDTYMFFDDSWIPQIPDDITGVARDFLDKCLAWNPSERLTAEKLLLHPFIAKPPPIPIWARNRKVARRTKLGSIAPPPGFEIPAGL